jgi:hypothetical protein
MVSQAVSGKSAITASDAANSNLVVLFMFSSELKNSGFSFTRQGAYHIRRGSSKKNLFQFFLATFLAVEL